jgi:bifunctional UDP-N-acetylglucosamine pyrophosphorylase/glucosamine-1-phosphate N-acetyltransferase
MSKVKSLGVIIMAAGKGTRMQSQLPKVLHQVCGRTLIERTIRAAAGLEPQEILVVVGYGSEQVISEIERVQKELSGDILISHALQAEQNGTGHAAQIGYDGFQKQHNSILIISGDTPLLDTETLSMLTSASSSELCFMSAHYPYPKGFGRVLRSENGKILGIKEDKDCSEEELSIQEINVSLYLAEASFLQRALASLEDGNAQNEFYLTDIVAYAVEQGDGIEGVCIDNAMPVLGANSRAELSNLEAYRRDQIIFELMDKGVAFEDVGTTFVEEDVTIGPDSYIGACSWLKGKTKIAENVCIQGNCYIVDSEIGSRSEIRFSSALEKVSIGCDCLIGPFARLRPDTTIDDEVKIGNFVETKKAHFAHGAKASHLSYIGDAKVGADANIGAGTITCNYDGKNKHLTEIGAGSFIGSNSALVAPVNIGEGSYVGAGSVITSNVPKESLGISRSRQKVIEGWAKRKNKV